MRLDPIMTWSPETGAIRHLTEDLLREVYLAPLAVPLSLAETLKDRKAPWSGSFASAPDATALAVEAGLTNVMRATLTLDPGEVRPGALPEGRARTHLAALRDLWADLGVLPPALDTIREVLRRDASEALEPLPVLDAKPCPHSDPIERALLQHLEDHHGTAPVEASRAWLGRQASSLGKAKGALGVIQHGLGRTTDQTCMDQSVAFYGLRDPREEAEFAAAFVQRMLEDGRADQPSEIGVLLPNDPGYGPALAEAFARLGIPLSGQPSEPERRDPVGELMLALLAIFEGPAPRTALATIYASRAMPWPRETGCRMAREVIERGWSRAANDYDGAGRRILESLRPVSTPRELVARLFAVDEAVPDLSLAQRIGELKTALGNEIDWRQLRRIGAPRPVVATGHDRFVESASIFTETALPWRPVRHLIALGMAGRQWPRMPGSDPFFTESEIALIRQNTGLGLRGRRETLARGLDLFRRQLCSATESATFLIPARNLRGDVQPVSTGLALVMHVLGKREPGELLTDIRASLRSSWPVSSELAKASPNRGVPLLPAGGTIDLERDLLTLRRDPSGAVLPQSPSRLETLLVSPFAWLLGELGARDRTWLPERLDVMTLGSLMHHVVELLFPEGQPVPSQHDIDAQVAQALEAAIRRHAAWLETSGWSTERANLLREAKTVARAWRGFLVGTKATIIHNEVDLSGEHQGLPISGRADCILKLPGDRILIIDHKRSRSTVRRDRMKKGWDLQVALYRAMLEHPLQDTPLTRMVREGSNPITAYHTMLDGTVLLDGDGLELNGAETCGDEISVNALEHLAEALADLRDGTIRLNPESDVKRLEKECSITPYALKDDGLVRAFLLPEDDGDQT